MVGGDVGTDICSPLLAAPVLQQQILNIKFTRYPGICMATCSRMSPPFTAVHGQYDAWYLVPKYLVGVVTLEYRYSTRIIRTW